MAIRHIGYACINEQLKHNDPKIFTGRTMRFRTFNDRGLEYVNTLILKNLSDLQKILNWNVQRGIYLFRVSSNLFPWWHKYNMEDLPTFDRIKSKLSGIGTLSFKYDLRLTFHPDHFTKLASLSEESRLEAIQEIELHSRIFDLMGFTPSVENKINIHVGGAYGDKKSTLSRFNDSINALSENARKRITVENDDRESLFSIKDLHESVEIPLVFDYFHHNFNSSGLSHKEALELAISTWPKNIVPVVHYSEYKEEGKNSHSDFIEGEIDTYGHKVDVMFEAKMKEQAVLHWRTKYAAKKSAKTKKK